MTAHHWDVVHAFLCGNLSMAVFFKIMELYVRYCEESMRNPKRITVPKENI
jgi:hypothetical protein